MSPGRPSLACVDESLMVGARRAFRSQNSHMTRAHAQQITRCFGTGDPLMASYHDDEWGHPVRDDIALFERLVLEGFQSGLSWAIILRKREGFRAAFRHWDVKRIAKFSETDVLRLMNDASIVRNRRKIDATITNAQALVALWAAGETLTELVWGHAPTNARPGKLRRWEDVPAATPGSRALAKALKARGFVFVGPVTMYALMQACGLVDCHLDTCHSRLTKGNPERP